MPKPKIITQTAYPIDKGVPIPPINKAYKGSTNPVYPWHRMEIGDSFFVGDARTNIVTRMACQTSARFPMKFTCRTLTENGVRGVRVWRVA